MLKKVITYTDYAGNIRTEDHYFNLTDAEITKWLLTSGEYTLDKVLERLMKERNMKKLMGIFDDLLHMSYGKKSLDGRRFEKSEEIWKEFSETEAYSQLFMELVSSGKTAADFINGIIPKEMADKIVKEISENPDGIPNELKDYMTAFPGA